MEARTPQASTPMIVGIVGAVLLVLGSFLTWATVSIDLGRFAAALGVDEATLGAAITGPTSRSASGLSDGADGIFTLVAGLVVIGLALLLRVKPAARKPIGLGIVVAGLVGAGVALYDISQVNDVRDSALAGLSEALAATGIGSDVLDGVVNVSTGIGIWICVVGGVVAIVAGLMAVLGTGPTTAAADVAAATTSAFGGSDDAGFAPPTAPAPAPAPPAAPVSPTSGAGSPPMPAPTPEAPPAPPADAAPTEGRRAGPA